MIVSWNWLKDYLKLGVSHEEVASRLMMAGLNHESTAPVGDDFAVDLEITSNRPDCLGHLGIAREIGVLFDTPLTIPDPQPAAAGPKVESLTSVKIEAPELCPRFTARVIEGVRIGSSPAWLANRLKTLGLNSVSNVVDVTNYVMFESGQPIHAFDFKALKGGKIIVRRAAAGEKFTALNHATYELDEKVCMIADAERTVGIAGIMGGLDTEVSPATTDLLIEVAEFAPSAIRYAARKLGLHSPASYRFERTVDPHMVDWTSRRCCELILKIAGGTLCEGVVDVGRAPPALPKVTLRYSQIPRILGIDVPQLEVSRILTALGAKATESTPQAISVTAPSWRRDLTREIDLVEEVARIHGYDKIPEDVGVRMAPSHKSDRERVVGRVRHALTASGIDECLTPSVVAREATETGFWTSEPPLVTNTPMLKGADHLRTSLIPSLLEVRRVNESLSNAAVELFEIASVYLPSQDVLPRELQMAAICSSGDFYRVKGVLESLVESVNATAPLRFVPLDHPMLDATRACEVYLGETRWGVIGELAGDVAKAQGIRGAVTIAEVRVDTLLAAANLIPRMKKTSDFPAMSRDLNLIVDEAIRWTDLESTVRAASGPSLEQVRYQETYRDAKRDGEGKKRLLFTLTLRPLEKTLTSEEADQVRDAVLAACKAKHAAVMVG
jgi:phenylalanyl-tRNA synthetase beta chain